MSLLRARLASYALPLVDPWPAEGGALTARTGWIIALEDDGGRIGLGDAAPFPGFGLETHASAGLALRGSLRRLVGLPAEDFPRALEQLPFLAPAAAAPTARHAIDLALHDLIAQGAGVPIARFLGGEAALAEVPANATVPRVDPERAAALARDAVGRGARTIKAKVGGGPVAEDVARIRALREAAGPDVRIRVDANQAWTADAAIEALRALAAFDLEYAEQPVAAEAVDALARVRRESGVPIAADESVRDEASARAVLDAGAADVLIVKPMALGGLLPARAVVDLARERGARVVVTSLLESVVGRTGALHLAASLGAGPHAHGIATGGVLARDLGPGPVFAGGVVRVPDAPGLGVALADAAAWRDAAVFEVE